MDRKQEINLEWPKDQDHFDTDSAKYLCIIWGKNVHWGVRYGWGSGYV